MNNYGKCEGRERERSVGEMVNAMNSVEVEGDVKLR